MNLKRSLLIFLSLVFIPMIHAQTGSDDFSTTAPNILGTCSSGGVTGDLSAATVGMATGFSVSCDGGGASGDTANNVIRACPAGFNNNTNWLDVWYQVDLPDGTDEMTLQITGLDPGEILAYVLHTADPGTNASNNTADVTGNFECSFFDDGVTSHTITGLAAESTAPLYIRILGIAFDDSNCSTIATPSFTICASAPQPNDVCNNAINITTNNLVDTGVASTGDLTQAADESNSIDCSGTAVVGADLWYEVLYPDVPSVIQDFYTELSLTGNAGDQYIVNVFDVTSACGSAGTVGDHCELITLTGGTDITTLGDIVSSDGQSREIQIIAVNATGPITVEGTVVYENNNCSHFQNVLPGYDITSAQPINFNYSTDSGALPATAGNDLWFQFSPQSGNDGFLNINSTSADVTVSGLTGDQEITILTYLGNGLSGDNCTNLATDYLSSITIDNDGTTAQGISCLSETHGSTDGGYLIRVVQTAGSTIANPTVTITPNAPGASNNSYGNICSGGSPTIGPTGNPNSDVGHNWNQYWIQTGETLVGQSFVGSNDCSIDATCNSVDYEAISEINDRDLWYMFQVPANQCTTLGLTQSTVIDNMAITYDANNATHDGVAYVYAACDPTTVLDCSGSLDGEGETWYAEGLTQGEYYLLRIKPWDISSTPTDWAFDIGVNDGILRPCNDLRANAEPLTVNACPDYASLDTYSSKGADDENTFGENDVWFSFVAPSPANGGPYFNANKSWVTVFLENVTAQNFTMELYQAGGTAIATGANAYSVSSVGDRVWGKFGNLDPGDTYMIRLRHNRPVTEEHQYKIEVNAEGPATGLGACGGTPNVAAARLCGSCGDVAFHGVQHTGVTLPSVESLCEEWYKVDLPEGTPGNKYWVIEVQGYDQVLDFELRSQYITETSANEGGEDDYDHPCTSRNLEPTANIVSSETTTVGYEVTAGGTYNFVGGRIGTANCQDTTDDPFPSPNYGGGRRKVFFGLNGPASGQKDYYYIRVFMDVDDPQFNDCANTGGVNIFPCGITFRGPYDSATEASAGGAVPGNPCALPVDLMSFEGEAKEKTNELTWNTASEENTSHFVVERSKDGKESFEKIGTAEAAGNSVELLSYTFDDEEPLAISYYRLKMVDFDGTYEYSDVISIRRKGKSIGFVNIAPIPTKSSLNISFEIQENTQLSITNMAGQVVRTMELTNENNGTLNLDVSQYAEGVYFMTLSDGQNIATEKFVIMR